MDDKDIERLEWLLLLMFKDGVLQEEFRDELNRYEADARGEILSDSTSFRAIEGGGSS